MQSKVIQLCAVLFVAQVGIELATGDTVIRSVTYSLYFGVETPAPVFAGPPCFEDGCFGWPVAAHPLYPETVNIFHTDVDITYDGCLPGGIGWDAFISHDFPVNDRRIELDEALLYLNQFTRVTLPVAGFEFTGVNVGEDLWILPQSDPGDVLWIGMNSPITSQVIDTVLAPWTPPGLGPARWTAFRLRGVAHDADDDGAFDDDGVFSMWQSSGPGQITLNMSSFDDGIPENGVDSDGITDSDVFYDAVPGHSHMNWGFSAPGIYRVDFQMETVIAAELPAPRFDIDWDTDVDLADFAAFQRCVRDEDEPYPCGCDWADGETDGDTDIGDFERFQMCSLGAEIIADPACNNE